MQRALSLASGTLRGLYFVNKYRFLTIAQFARIAGFSRYHAGETLRTLERRGAVGFFGFTSIPGHGKTPKVYYLKRRGFEFLLTETDYEVGEFVEPSQELSWSPAMYHRIRLIDLFVSLEVQVFDLVHLRISQVLLEYRRLPRTFQRETTDYVSEEPVSENRIVPDGVFILENLRTERQGLFFVEMDMGTERLTAPASRDQRATIRGKFEQYDRYLRSGRFALRYAGFRSFTLLLVTYGEDRVENIRKMSARMSADLHNYYRLTTYEQAVTDFLGLVWKSRDPGDRVTHALIAQSADNP